MLLRRRRSLLRVVCFFGLAQTKTTQHTHRASPRAAQPLYVTHESWVQCCERFKDACGVAQCLHSLHCPVFALFSSSTPRGSHHCPWHPPHCTDHHKQLSIHQVRYFTACGALQRLLYVCFAPRSSPPLYFLGFFFVFFFLGFLTCSWLKKARQTFEQDTEQRFAVF